MTVSTVIFVSPWLIIIVIGSFCYLYRIRKRCLSVTRDTIRLKFALMSPVNSLIQDAINGLPTIRCLRRRKHFLNLLFEHTDYQTSAHITSSGGHRWTCLRIDSQAFLITVSFALIAMFFQSGDRSPEELALTAIGL